MASISCSEYFRLVIAPNLSDLRKESATLILKERDMENNIYIKACSMKKLSNINKT